MLELLQANHRMRGGDLARRLGVDERTVRRYATRLEDLGVPVVSERGRHGGYRLMPGYKLPPLMFTDDEATAVVLGLLAGRRIGLPGQATESALAKVRRVLPAAIRDRVQALQETLEFTAPARGAARDGAAPGTDPDMRTVLTLAAAARERRRVRLRYRSWRGTETGRDLDSYGLVFHSGRWYVTGHDHRSGEIRTFRVDRVVSAEPGAVRYEIPDGVDAVQHVTRSLARVPWTHEVEVVLETTLAEARRRIPATVATLTEDGGGVVMTARAERLDGMARMLAGLGFPFAVRRPDELRGHVRDLARTLEEHAAR
ncbi:YafY family transcriptional regulator [Actinomadura spongiicola]|uniref:YafY family transcriptional regulator n=2 Tax=Actinomadura spongiicola TaxID=2303421 RepID=A0A372GBN2_9ACTN|nr:YafY family transcriptional regulator [Actinomadura spongiicola]